MKYLVVESVAAKPHLETAGEIALDLAERGELVGFAFIGDRLPWTDWDLPRWLKWFGCSLERRVERFERIISERGIKLSPASILTGEKLDSCRRFAEGFSGGFSELKEYRYGDACLGMGVASSLVSLHGDSRFDVARHSKITQLALLSACLVYERCRALIRAARPDVVITFNGRFATCKPIIEAAAAERVLVLRHERGSMFDKYELFEEPPHSFEYIRRRIGSAWQAADPLEREEIGHSFFARRRNGDGIGWYSFVQDQVRGKAPERIPGRRRIVYFSSSDDEYAAISDTVAPGRWGDQIRAVQDLIGVCEGLDDVELVVRVHPHLGKKSSAERSRWHGLSGANVRLIPAESKVDSYALLDSADVVVTYGSTIGIEAAYWGKPSVLVGPSTYAGLGVCFEPATKAELAELLRKSARLAPQPREKCLPYGHYYVTYGKQYRHYSPESLSEGKFLGDRLNWDSLPIRVLRRFGAGKIYNSIRRTIR